MSKFLIGNTNRRQITPLVAAILCSLTAAHSASAATRYVSPTGKNTGPGTSRTAPWATIQYAAENSLAGDVVEIDKGTYEGAVDVKVSGKQGSPIIFRGQGSETIISGAKLKPNAQAALVTIRNQSFINIENLTITGLVSTTADYTPIGVLITDAASNVEIRDTRITGIANNFVGDLCSSEKKNPKLANAHGLAVFGTNSSTSIKGVRIIRNQIDNLKLGCSEALVVNGNVEDWEISRNSVHDNDNIAIDAIGYEGVGGNGANDIARDGIISYNEIYNISSLKNNSYKERSAGGIYCDGCARVTIDGNTIRNSDYGIEIASEHRNTNSTGIIVRNNIIYNNYFSGLSVGGYDDQRGGTTDSKFINNSFYNNGLDDDDAGEFQIQWYTKGNVFANNIAYTSSEKRVVSHVSSSAGVSFSNNLYYVNGTTAAKSRWRWNNKDVAGFDAFTKAVQEKTSTFADPLYVKAATAGTDLHVRTGSPAIDKGTAFSEADVGELDRDEKKRLKGTLDIGAYEQ